MRGRSWNGRLVVTGLLSSIFIIGAILTVIVAGAVGDSAKRPPIDEQITRLQLPEGVTLDSLQRATVQEIVDGDTIDVTIDGVLWKIRYFGVDTPERGTRCFREATDRNDLLIGKTVLLLPDERDEDQFGRLLRYVFLEDGTSVDATLVAEGFGEAWRQDGRYRDQIVDLEAGARAAHRGCLWKEEPAS
jgi:micrococcal nuclease